MIVSMSRSNASCVVTFGEYAQRVAMNRFGHYEAIIPWPEFQALAAGVDRAATPEQGEARLREGMAYFRKRQHLP